MIHNAKTKNSLSIIIPYSVGASLFQQAKWFELTEQCRASEDPEQTQFVQRVSTGASFDVDEIFSFPHLTQEDLCNEEWLKAPMIVALNHERSVLTHERSLAYAKHTGNLVIRWPAKFTPIKGRSNQLPSIPNHSAYHEYFVADMDGFLTDTISKPLGLVNAQQIIFRSLVPANPMDEQLINDAIASGATHMVTLSEKPALILVEIPENALMSLPDHAKQKLQELSIQDGKVIIPISSKASKEPMEVFDIDNPLNTVTDINATPWFPIELGFAITCEKSEGRTLHRAILALSRRNKHNFTWEALNVATSRVKQRNHMRIFLNGETPRQQKASISYISNLRPDPSVESFFHGHKTEIDRHWTERSFNARAAAVYFVNHTTAFLGKHKSAH